MPEELARQAQALSDQVRRLSERLTVSRKQVERVRVLAIGAIVIGLVVMVLGVFSAVLWWEIRQTQQVSCENANASRAGSREAWGELMTLSTESLKAQAAAEGEEPSRVILRYYERFGNWIENEQFPDRDCSDLSKEYPPPKDPPSFRRALEEAVKQAVEDQKKAQ